MRAPHRGGNRQAGYHWEPYHRIRNTTGDGRMGEPVYGVHLLSETGRSIRSSIGVSLARIAHGVR